MTTELVSTVGRRLYELFGEGERLLQQFPHDYSIEFQKRAECVAWLLSAVNILEVATPPGSRYRAEAMRLAPKADEVLFPNRIAAILGLLKSAAAEWTAGLLDTLEFRFVGLAFDDFLKHAAEHNENGKREVAAVLASAVLEDTVKRLCRRHNIASDNKTLDSLISALKAKDVLNRVKAERLRSHAKLRNQAFHAEWGAFDQRDLRQMIEDVSEILETHFR